MPRFRADQLSPRYQDQVAAALYEDHPHAALPHAELECHEAPALGAAVSGKAEGVSRTLVRFTGYRCKPLDPDNFAGSCKDLLDGLRHAGLILGDEPWRITLLTEQFKVTHRRDEKTVIEIVLDSVP